MNLTSALCNVHAINRFVTCEADEPFSISANCESDMCMHSTGATEALNISLADQRNKNKFFRCWYLFKCVSVNLFWGGAIIGTCEGRTGVDISDVPEGPDQNHFFFHFTQFCHVCVGCVQMRIR